jgi:hypothetical protein
MDSLQQPNNVLICTLTCCCSRGRHISFMEFGGSMGAIILKQSGSNYFGEFVDSTTFTGGSFDTSLAIGSFDTSLGLTLAFVGVNKTFFDHSDILINSLLLV